MPKVTRNFPNEGIKIIFEPIKGSHNEFITRLNNQKRGIGRPNISEQYEGEVVIDCAKLFNYFNSAPLEEIDILGKLTSIPHLTDVKVTLKNLNLNQENVRNKLDKLMKFLKLIPGQKAIEFVAGDFRELEAADFFELAPELLRNRSNFFRMLEQILTNTNNFSLSFSNNGIADVEHNNLNAEQVQLLRRAFEVEEQHHLTLLNLSNCHLSDADEEVFELLSTLVESDVLSTIDLSTNQFSLDALKVFARILFILKFKRTYEGKDDQHELDLKLDLPELSKDEKDWLMENEIAKIIKVEIGDNDVEELLRNSNDVEVLLRNAIEHSQLTTLNLSERELTNEDLTRLSRALRGDVGRLHRLNLSQNNLHNCAAILTDIISNNMLLDGLDLSQCSLNKEDVDILFSTISRVHRNLKQLNLARNNLEEGGVIEIANYLKQNLGLRELYLSGNNLEFADAEALGEALEKNETLEMLNISANKLGSIARIAKALKRNRKLTTANFSNNDLKIDDLIALIQNSTLTSIDWSHNIFKVADPNSPSGFVMVDIARLAEALARNQTLISLNLLHTNLGRTKNRRLFFDALAQNTCLTEIDLSYNHLYDEGIIELAYSLRKNRSLTSIKLVDNCRRDENDHMIGWDEGAVHLFNVLETNSTVTNLDLSLNSLGIKSAEALAKALRINKTLTTIKFSNNSILDAGAKIVADALKVNQTLTELNLKDNFIGNEGFKDLAEALKVNKALKKFQISYNNLRNENSIDEITPLVEAIKINRSLTEFEFSTHQNLTGAELIELFEALYISNKVREHFHQEKLKIVNADFEQNADELQSQLDEQRLAELQVEIDQMIAEEEQRRRPSTATHGASVTASASRDAGRYPVLPG